jgi:hypothetical protein
LRLWVGMSAGESFLDAEIQIYDLSRSRTNPLYSFRTSGGSKAQAGVLGAVEDIDEDISRAAREIRDFLKKHMN